MMRQLVAALFIVGSAACAAFTPTPCVETKELTTFYCGAAGMPPLPLKAKKLCQYHNPDRWTITSTIAGQSTLVLIGFSCAAALTEDAQ